MQMMAKKIRPAASRRPPVAVELAPEGVLAASVQGDVLSYAFAPLAGGVVAPGIAEANLKTPAAVVAAVKRALGEVAPAGKAVTLVVPDNTVRIFVLDFDAFPAKAAEALPVLRFRLRKTLPFEVEDAAISYQRLGNGKAECRVLVAVMPAEIRAEYEDAVRAAGYEPGVVINASLAMVGAVAGGRGELVANLSEHAMTTAIVQGDDLLLYRMVELPTDEEARREEIRRGVAVSQAYYEDKLIEPASRLLLSARTLTQETAAENFASILGDDALKIEELVARPVTGATTALGVMSVAAVTGALKGGA